MSRATTLRPKLELAVNVEEAVTLLAREPHFDVGQYGTWALISVEHRGQEKTWFPPYHVAVHLKNTCGLGDLVSICKRQQPGSRATRWLLDGVEIPFVPDPSRPEFSSATENNTGSGREEFSDSTHTSPRMARQSSASDNNISPDRREFSESAQSSPRRAPQATSRDAAHQPIARERLNARPGSLKMDPLKLEALRAAIDYAKGAPVSQSLDPEQVVEAARAFQIFLKEG